MADPLQPISDDHRRQRPVPLGEEEHREAGERQRDADEVDREAERMLVPLEPVAQETADWAAPRGGGGVWRRCGSHAVSLWMPGVSSFAPRKNARSWSERRHGRRATLD